MGRAWYGHVYGKCRTWAGCGHGLRTCLGWSWSGPCMGWDGQGLGWAKHLLYSAWAGHGLRMEWDELSVSLSLHGLGWATAVLHMGLAGHALG